LSYKRFPWFEKFFFFKKTYVNQCPLVREVLLLIGYRTLYIPILWQERNLSKKYINFSKLARRALKYSWLSLEFCDAIGEMVLPCKQARFYIRFFIISFKWSELVHMAKTSSSISWRDDFVMQTSSLLYSVFYILLMKWACSQGAAILKDTSWRWFRYVNKLASIFGFLLYPFNGANSLT
jgi:hypothetical protein